MKHGSDSQACSSQAGPTAPSKRMAAWKEASQVNGGALIVVSYADTEAGFSGWWSGLPDHLSRRLRGCTADRRHAMSWACGHRGHSRGHIVADQRAGYPFHPTPVSPWHQGKGCGSPRRCRRSCRHRREWCVFASQLLLPASHVHSMKGRDSIKNCAPLNAPDGRLDSRHIIKW